MHFRKAVALRFRMFELCRHCHFQDFRPGFRFWCDYKKLHCDYRKLHCDYRKLHCCFGLTGLKSTNHSRIISLCILLAVLYWTVWYVINCAQDWNWIIHFTHDLHNILYCSVVFDVWLTSLLQYCMFLEYSLCMLLVSTVNIGKCKQQVRELFLHTITIKF
jgi:hypothetical protein